MLEQKGRDVLCHAGQLVMLRIGLGLLADERRIQTFQYGGWFFCGDERGQVTENEQSFLEVGIERESVCR